MTIATFFPTRWPLPSIEHFHIDKVEHDFHGALNSANNNKLGPRFQHVKKMSPVHLWLSEMPPHKKKQLSSCTGSHGLQLHCQKLGDVRLFHPLPNFFPASQSTGIDRPCTSKQCKSPPSLIACIVWLSLLFPRTVQPNMSNDVTIVVGSSLLVVNILGSCAFPRPYSCTRQMFCCCSVACRFSLDLSTLSATVSRRYRGCAM